jgi:hypothetical protein
MNNSRKPTGDLPEALKNKYASYFTEAFVDLGKLREAMSQLGTLAKEERDALIKEAFTVKTRDGGVSYKKNADTGEEETAIIENGLRKRDSRQRELDMERAVTEALNP